VKTRLLLSLLLSSFFAFPALAQDSKYRPTNQQIPVPDCLNMKGLWDGGYKPCTPEDHKIWLADIMHWRNERRMSSGCDALKISR
jgi:gamma-glutamyl hercynylcysteine S-oxide synthase